MYVLFRCRDYKDHLFFKCSVAKYIWGIVSCSFSLHKIPESFEDIPRWLESFHINDRLLISVGVAALIWAIWKTRKKACFDGVFLQDPISIVFLMAHYISYWAGLQKQSLRGLQRKGAKMVVLVATEFFHRKQGWGPLVLRLGGP